MTKHTSGALPILPVTLGRDDAIFIDKGDGTTVHYYLFPEYEVHANIVQPGSVQGWHHHRQITETLFITKGQIEARWLSAQRAVERRLLVTGSLFDVGASVHTFANPSQEVSEFLVFRFVPDGVDKRDLISGDRFADEIAEA